MKQCIQCKKYKEPDQYGTYNLNNASGVRRECTVCINARIYNTNKVRLLARRDTKKQECLDKALAKYTQTVADIHARFDIR